MPTQPSVSSVSSLHQGRRPEQVSVPCPTPIQPSMSSTPSVQQDPESVTRPPTFLELACGDKKEKYQFLKAYTTLYGRHALLAKLSTLAHKQKEHNNTKRHAQDEGWFDEARLQDLILSRAQLPEPMRHEKERQEFHEVKALLARNCASEYEYQAFLVRRGAELHDLSRRDRDIFRAYKLDARDARYTADKHEAYAIRHGRSFRVHEAALQKRRRPGPGKSSVYRKGDARKRDYLIDLRGF